MESYTLESKDTIEAERIIDEIKSIKDLLNIDFSNNSDNIILLKKIVRVLYSEFTRLQQEVNSIKPRIRN